jgi:hypothetical protein
VQKVRFLNISNYGLPLQDSCLIKVPTTWVLVDLRFGPGTDLRSDASRAVLNSLFGRANFNYNNTYFLSASLRAETYSGFGRDNQTGLFPAVSAGADFTQIFDMGIFQPV